jgi:hypothetical protein
MSFYSLEEFLEYVLQSIILNAIKGFVIFH